MAVLKLPVVFLNSAFKPFGRVDAGGRVALERYPTVGCVVAATALRAERIITDGGIVVAALGC